MKYKVDGGRVQYGVEWSEVYEDHNMRPTELTTGTIFLGNNCSNDRYDIAGT